VLPIGKAIGVHTLDLSDIPVLFRVAGDSSITCNWHPVFGWLVDKR
jgi:hypothetical protein